jgi:ABC-2 type transport system ATP-binding protein
MTAASSSQARTPVLTAHQITKRYGRRDVLRGVGLTLHRGELVALLGPNGSGKTTLMSILVAATRPSSGSIAQHGVTPGWVPQGAGTYGRLTVRENLELFATLLLPDQHAASSARDAAERAHLLPWFDQPARSLSGGTRQRLNIAIGMLGSPQVTILDEPTTGVDLAHRNEMWGLLQEHVHQGGTVLYSTHSTDDAALADRVLVLVDGRVVWDGELAGVAQFAPQYTGRTAQEPAQRALQLDPVSQGLLALWGEVR